MEVLNDVCSEYITGEAMLARIFARKYFEQGCISEENIPLAIDSFQAQLKNIGTLDDIYEACDSGILDVTLEDDILEPDYKGREVLVNIEITDEDVKIEKKFVEETIGKAAHELANMMIEDYGGWWKKVSKKELRRIKRERKNFSAVVYEMWGSALDRLDVLIDLCSDLGSEFNNTYRHFAVTHFDHKFEALTRIHAKSCQVSCEIHSLLCSGFADGAYARWRTLRELAIISGFLMHHDDETSRRFLLHAHLEEYELMKHYESDAKRLNWAPIDPKILEEAGIIAKELTESFTEDFQDHYGWAAHIIKPKKRRRILLFDLEEHLSQVKEEFPYNVAHKNVHASAYSTLFPTSAHPYNDLLIAGGSVFGLSEPGKQTAQAICEITGYLLLTRTQMDNLIQLKALLPIRDEVWELFDMAESKIRENIDSSYELSEKYQQFPYNPHKVKRWKSRNRS